MIKKTFEKSVYIIATPYHFILAVGIAAYVDKAKEKRLIVSSHFQNADKLVDALKKWDLNPFSRIDVLAERGSSGVFGKISTIRANLKQLDGLLPGKKGEGLNAFIFNIEQPEGQFVAYTNHEQGGKDIYVEDGVGAYTERRFDDPIHMKIAKKILYGTWFRRVDTQINYPFFDLIMVLRPELIPRKPENAELERIPNDIFSRLDKDGLVEKIYEQYGESTEFECETIILVPNSLAARLMGYEKIVKTYSQILDALEKNGTSTIVKYHPRETKGDYLNVGKRKGFTIVHPSITSELLFLRWKSGKRMSVIGDTTTALCSCRIITPAATAISIVDIIGFEDNEGVRRIFDYFGVVRPESMDALVSLLG